MFKQFGFNDSGQPCSIVTTVGDFGRIIMVGAYSASTWNALTIKMGGEYGLVETSHNLALEIV